MIIQKINGGLGNQMFQYAFIKALSLGNNSDFKLDISGYQMYFRPYELEIFAIKKNYANFGELPRYENLKSRNRYLNYLGFRIGQYFKKQNSNHYIEENMIYNSEFTKIKSGYIEGFFQSEKYFKNYEKEIKSDFCFIKALSPRSEEIQQKIDQLNSISVHIRRGDYLKGNNLAYHGICDLDYYKNAIGYFVDRIENPLFFFFSDDMEWVKETFRMKNAHYVDWNRGEDSRQDMKLMSYCKHNIIANSSFSRWGAWLNTNPAKEVIAPKKWFANPSLDDQDIVPEKWIKI